MTPTDLDQLGKSLEGSLHYDEVIKTLYATDASAYREIPTAVAFPKSKEDIRQLIQFANEKKTSLIPRTAGTSLAGQVVGDGIIVDVSRDFTRILEVNEKESWVRLEPGVIRDELNLHLKTYNLFFGPETSTSNRCMVGGMVGNNSCGSRSVIYGSARDHLLETSGYLADGTFVTFGALSNEEFQDKVAGKTTASPLEQKIYEDIHDLLSQSDVRKKIEEAYPKKSIPRRNTGYALDLLAETAPFSETNEKFNFCKLIAGSEGTLFFMTELKFNLVPAPPKSVGLLCAHFDSIDDSLKANIIALKHNPSACELIDHYILDCTKNNIEHSKNRFFVQGEPKAILVIEFPREREDQMMDAAQACIDELKANGLGNHFPILTGSDIPKIWALRKAGLGLLSNMPGDAKPQPVIEDTAVDVNDLPAFIADFNKTLAEHDLYCVHYAHAGSGELHLRPILNMKTEEGHRQFRLVAEEIAALVKKYKGSLSGEHGDGRLRGEFIKFMVGDEVNEWIKAVKYSWDENNIFNPGKIVDTPPMDSSLRYTPGQETPQFDTVYSWDKNKGIIRAAEMCNGSGDCRKTHLSGGTMCPSYMATKSEKHTTRARANILREMLTHSPKANRFDHEEILEVMDLCLSCKGCKSECPSNVDMAKMKGEAYQQYYDTHGVPAKTQRIADIVNTQLIGSHVPGIANFMLKNKFTSRIILKKMGFTDKRTLPELSPVPFTRWFYRNRPTPSSTIKKVLFFSDEFTNFTESHIAQKAVRLLTKLGYEIELLPVLQSGRTYLSKGMIRRAKEICNDNLGKVKHLLDQDIPVIGLEPSAILTFRDEYLDLADESNMELAKNLAQKTLLIDEFLSAEIEAGNIQENQFSLQSKKILLHGHCHQKALSDLNHTLRLLSLPANYKVEVIPSGCCGMAGSFGYEEDHYVVSMAIGNLVLFPTVKEAPEDTLIAAPGTSCRHQIKDGTERSALHPIEILEAALKD